MKKVFTTFLLVIVLCIVLISCDVTDNEYSSISSTNSSGINNYNTSTNTQDTLDSIVPDDNEDLNVQDIPVTVDTSIKVEYDAEREASDNEFPFDDIIVERNGYDIVSAGKYYGDDFNNVKYYGSYYRIIDNYEDFSELTQWGNQLDEAVFDENFIFVLYSYSNCSVYYSHPNFYEFNGLGQFDDLKMDTSTDKLNIYEFWVLNGGMPDKDDYTPLDYNDYKVVFPKEVHEIIYLIISKKELPNSMNINGEVKLRKVILKAE